MSADASWAVHKCFEVSSLLSERSGIEVHWECHRSWLFLVLTNAGQRSDLLSGTCSAHAHAARQLGIPMTLCAEVSVLVERHLHLPALGEGREQPLGLHFVGHRDGQRKALEARHPLAAAVGSHHRRVGGAEGRMHHLVSRLGRYRGGLMRLGAVLEAHEHRHLGAERLAVELQWSPAARSTDATLEIQTTPGASCSITVLYKSGPSRAKGLGPKTADGKGRVVWQWRVGSNTTPGEWPIIVSCSKGEERRQLRTAFEVR